MSSDIAARLEAVTARLEALAKKGFGGGGGDDDGEGAPPYVGDFQNILNNEVELAAAAADKVGAKGIRPILLAAFGNVNDFIAASAQSKKPSNTNAMMAFLKPTVNAINDAEKLKFKRVKVENHNAALYELITGISWCTLSPPQGLPLEHVKAQSDATDFHLNRVLKKFKDDAKKEDHRAFVKALKALNAASCAYVKQYFKTGIAWNFKGGDLASFTPGAAAAAAKPAAAAPAKKASTAKKTSPAKKSGGAAGMFAELKKKGAAGGGQTAAVGLKKVTKDMKTKYRKDRGGKVTMADKKKTAKPKKPSNIKNMGGRWMLEHYHDVMEELPAKISVKENVFITTSEGATFVIKQKIKAVTIDSCKKCRIFVNGVVSTVEMVNCKSVTLILQGPVPSVQIDKSDSPRIIIQKAAMDPLPTLITSNISAGNVEIPGETDDSDPVEIPLPEQFINTIDVEKKTIETVTVSHG